MKDISITYLKNSSSPMVFYINNRPYFYTVGGQLFRIDKSKVKIKVLARKFHSGNSYDRSFDDPNIHEVRNKLFPGLITLNDRSELHHYITSKHRMLLADNVLAMSPVFTSTYTSEGFLNQPRLYEQFFATLDKNNKIHTFFVGDEWNLPSQLHDERQLPLDKKVINSYSSGNWLLSILQTDNNDLYIWQPLHHRRRSRFKDVLHKIPGKEVKVLAKTLFFEHDVPLHYSEAFITDEGLFHIFKQRKDYQKYYAHLNHASMLLDKLYEGLLIYRVPLPENVSPDDVKELLSPHFNNLFLLTNEGKVYAIGKNTYYQRGTKEKLDPSEWNEIKYPEKIKQIDYTSSPGLFALSEDGNLYYHGDKNRGYLGLSKSARNYSPVRITQGIKGFKTGVKNIFFIDNHELPISFRWKNSHEASWDKLEFDMEAFKAMKDDVVITREGLSRLVSSIC